MLGASGESTGTSDAWVQVSCTQPGMLSCKAAKARGPMQGWQGKGSAPHGYAQSCTLGRRSGAELSLGRLWVSIVVMAVLIVMVMVMSVVLNHGHGHSYRNGDGDES